MVMSLPQPATPSVDLVDAVVAERQQGRNAQFFSQIRVQWRAEVQAYIAHGGSPAHVKPWPAIASMKTAFLTLYSSPKDGSSQGMMLQALRDHNLNICPACGESGRPNTLDHYLPKGEYPHFAVTPLNLFPMCDGCQAAKGEKTGDATTPRYFIHPYFDTFSNPQVIELSISAPFDTPSFGLDAHNALGAGERALVAAHLRELKICDRYIRFFRGAHLRVLRLVARMRANGQIVVDNLDTFKFNASSPSPNSWDHVFYDGVLKNADLIDYFVNGALPDFL